MRFRRSPGLSSLLTSLGLRWSLGLLVSTLAGLAGGGVPAHAQTKIPQINAPWTYPPKFRGVHVVITHTAAARAGVVGLVALAPGQNVLNVNVGTQILDPVWNNITVLPDAVFALRNWDDPTWVRIPVEQSGKKWKVGQPTPTIYKKVYASSDNGRENKYFPRPVFLGLREVSPEGLLLIDVLDDSGQPVATLDRILRPTEGPKGPAGNVKGKSLDAGLDMLSENVLAARFRDELGNELLGLMDRRGAFLGPPLANVRTFAPPYRYYEMPYAHYAVPLDAAATRFMPLRLDGTMPIETSPIKGYIPVNILRLRNLINGWLKEYDENGVSIWGWCTPDLEEQTGAIWRTVREYRPSNAHWYLLGQLRDGTWMVYERRTIERKSGADVTMPEALLPKPAATEQAAIDGIFGALQARHNKATQAALAQMTSTATPSDGRVTAVSLAAEIPSLRLDAMALDTALYKGDWIEARHLASRIGGDFAVLYHLAHGNRGGAPYPGFWYQLSVQARHPKLKAEAYARYEARDAELRRQHSADIASIALAKQAREGREASAREAARRWMLTTGAEQAALAAAKPSEAARAQAVQTYMQNFDRYVRGQQSWEPPKPTGFAK